MLRKIISCSIKKPDTEQLLQDFFAYYTVIKKLEKILTRKQVTGVSTSNKDPRMVWEKLWMPYNPDKTSFTTDLPLSTLLEYAIKITENHTSYGSFKDKKDIFWKTGPESILTQLNNLKENCQTQLTIGKNTPFSTFKDLEKDIELCLVSATIQCIQKSKDFFSNTRTQHAKIQFRKPLLLPYPIIIQTLLDYCTYSKIYNPLLYEIDAKSLTLTISYTLDTNKLDPILDLKKECFLKKNG